MEEERTCKNYFTDGGDTLIINGKLVVGDDATVEGLDTGGGESYTLPAATTTTLGGVRQCAHYDDFSDTSYASFQTHFNQFLGSLRDAGIVA